MKTLILYSSKRGTTLKCSKLIAAKSTDFDMIDIKENKSPNLEPYERVYIGSPVYYGKINKRISQFISTNKDILLKKDLRIFTVGMDDNNIQDTRKNNFDKDVLDHAKIIYAGGAYNFEEMSWFERFIVKRISSVNESYQNIKKEAIIELTK